jgi:gmma-aminobutyric acid receptor subunit gamma/cGMP-dependent protein kinase 2
MPKVWKSADIRPIPKCAGASEAKDFRPIALTSIVGKCLERLVMKRLSPLLNDPTQFTYKPNRSTEDALITLIDSVTEHLDSNAKNRVRALFIDFSSAFNTINPAILINKLESYKIHPNIVNWLYDFLTNRSQRVVTPLSTSQSLNTSTGSPQGCVISLLLFSLYVIDMPSSDNIKPVKYAEDTVIVELLADNQPSELQTMTDNMYEWCSTNDLILNAKKTKL